MIGRILVVVCLGIVLAMPFVFRHEQAGGEADRRLIIFTPHNEQIRDEFGRGFADWHERVYGSPVRVEWNVPGGTSEIRRLLESQYAAAFESGRPPGGEADLVFGGGSYEHGRLKRGVAVAIDGETRREPITAAVDFTDEWLARTYGPNVIGGGQLYDPDRLWFGTALSGFGIVYNRDALGRLGLDEPRSWDDLGDPRLGGWVALVNPSQSGSIATAFDTILQRRGWEEGWRILRRAAANARYFSGSSLKPPTDVGLGDAAMGVCIDFYGRYEAHAIEAAGGGRRVGYVDPPGQTLIDADPISMLRGARDPELAKRFIEYCLSDDGQALWQFRIADRHLDGLGPVEYELRRMPILRSMYTRFTPRMIDQIDPYEVAAPIEHPNRDIRVFIAPMFAAMAMDQHRALERAWRAIVARGYPSGMGVVTAEDVDDPVLARMLERFDAMPAVAGPDGETFSLQIDAHLATIKSGWLGRGWADAGLWPREATPADELRRRWGAFFRANYRDIVAMGRDAGPTTGGTTTTTTTTEPAR